MLEVSNLSECGPSWNEDTGGDDGWCEFNVTLTCDCCGKVSDPVYYEGRHSDMMCTECFFNDYMSDKEGFERRVDGNGKPYYVDLETDEEYYIEDADELADAADIRYMSEDYLDDDIIAEAVERAREDEYDY